LIDILLQRPIRARCAIFDAEPAIRDTPRQNGRAHLLRALRGGELRAEADWIFEPVVAADFGLAVSSAGSRGHGKKPGQATRASQPHANFG
jgi:hypothetical protein